MLPPIKYKLNVVFVILSVLTDYSKQYAGRVIRQAFFLFLRGRHYKLLNTNLRVICMHTLLQKAFDILTILLARQFKELDQPY
jgi:hypothetical protein